MDIQTIATFLVIVKQGSFQGAAAELKYAQSTITKQIQNLERELNVKLFERGKKIRLTYAGETLLQKAERLIHDYTEIQQSMSELSDGENGVVTIGIMEPTASYRLPPLIKQFNKRYPNVEICIKIHNSHMFNHMVGEGSVDFAICASPESGLGTVFEPLFAEKTILLLPDSHHLVQKERIHIHDLRDELILLTNDNCPFRRRLELALHEGGGTPYRRMEIGNMAALKYYVQVEYGVAAVPQVTVCPPPEGTIIRQLENFDIRLTTGLLMKKDKQLMSAAARKLADFLRQELGKLSVPEHVHTKAL